MPQYQLNNHIAHKEELTSLSGKLAFQSRVVTSLLFSLVFPLKCFNTRGFGADIYAGFPEGPSAMVQILAVESPELETISSILVRTPLSLREGEQL